MAAKFVRVLSLVFIVLGVIGFFLPLEAIFHLTPVHNSVHLLSGVIGLWASSSESKSALYARIFGLVYLGVAVLGLFTHEFLGIIFLLADNILHFIIAFASIYVGFASASKSKNASSDRTLSQ
ncbi:DUF4383 domain-containing protein [Bacillus sp. DJP31]|uniref:DUF4383 domain-containing protein n=1 Tax=Bacillus sp. DJP31 TaxID=3409789 RepID=UPI003BB714F3